MARSKLRVSQRVDVPVYDLTCFFSVQSLLWTNESSHFSLFWSSDYFFCHCPTEHAQSPSPSFGGIDKSVNNFHDSENSTLSSRRLHLPIRGQLSSWFNQCICAHTTDTHSWITQHPSSTPPTFFSTSSSADSMSYFGGHDNIRPAVCRIGSGAGFHHPSWRLWRA